MPLFVKLPTCQNLGSGNYREVKMSVFTVCLAILFIGCSRSEKSVDYRPAISTAMISFREEVLDTNNIVLVRHPAIHSLFLSAPASTNLDLPGTVHNLANHLQSVDVTQCPEDFRLAWIDLVHTLEDYQIGAAVGHGVASGAAGVVALRTGSKEAGDLAAREFEEITTQGDIKFAYQNLETVCMKYGVQPSLQKPAKAAE